MKKIILSTALVSAAFLGSVQLVSADEVKKAETPIGIEFEKIGSEVEGPYKGVLTLAFKPSALEFGKYKATGAQITAPATSLGGQNEKQWLVINDDRDNTAVTAPITDAESVKGGTWNLTATMAELSDGKTAIPATLNLNFDDVQKYEMGTNPSDDNLDYEPVDPNAGGVTGALTGEHKIELNKAVSLEAGKTDEVVVIKKAEKTADKVGVATELTSSNLVVQPSKDYKGGKLTSKVTWTLSTGI